MKRIFSCIMAITMALSMSAYTGPTVFAQKEESQQKEMQQQDKEASSLTAILHFLEPISKKEIQEQKITATLFLNGNQYEKVDLNDATTNIGDYPISVVYINNEQKGQDLQVTILQLPEGNHKLSFSGTDFQEEMKVDEFTSEENVSLTLPIEMEPKISKTESTQNQPQEARLKALFQRTAPLKGANSKGTISATLRFDYLQTLEAIEKQEIEITLFKDDKKVIGFSYPDKTEMNNANGTSMRIKANDEYGDPIDLLTEDVDVRYLNIEITGLEQGNYQLKFKGNGYKEYTSKVSIDDYSKHVILGTSDETFTVGDVNGDGAVNSTDLEMVENALESTNAKDLKLYDINKDGKINLLDIAYVNHQIGAYGKEQQFDTSFMNISNIKTGIEKSEVKVDGDLMTLFQSGTDTVTLTTQGTANEISLPIEFDKPIEMEQIEIVSPAGDGAVQQGKAVVVYEDGTMDTIDFGETVPKGVKAIELDSETKTVTIPLKKRVAVKKIVIQVTKVENQDGSVDFAVIQDIHFLKDIVPDNPTPVNTTVRNLTVQPGNESVTLNWNALPNVTGYLVEYGDASGKYTNQMTVNTTQAKISGLKNLINYYFVVTPINGDWKGNISEEKSAMPMPSAAPNKPDNLNVTSMDKALKLTWGKTENATYYKVYYREKKDEDKKEEFKLVTDSSSTAGKITGITKTIGGLVNDTTYEVYVIAGNTSGESKPSLISEGIPKAINVENPVVPEGNISNDHISVSMKNKNNWDRNLYPNGFDVKNVIDGDYSTHWVGRIWSESNEFTFKFDKPIEMNYLVYVARLDGNFRKSLSKYSISVDEDGSGTFKPLVTGRSISNSARETGVAILPFEKTKVSSIKVSVAQWEGSPTNISLSEILFYEYDSSKDLNSQVADLFKDGSFTEVKDGVDLAEIENLETLLGANSDYMIDSAILKDELNLAKALVQGNTNKLGVVHDTIIPRQGLQPLGVAAKANSKIVIYSALPESTEVSIVATQYFAEASQWQNTVVEKLEPGRNVITIPKIGSISTERGGPLYLKYNGDANIDGKIQIRQATDIPVLELADWYAISEDVRKDRISKYIEELKVYTWKGSAETAVLNCTEISMPNVLLSIPADSVQKAIAESSDGVQRLYDNTLAWEEVMHIAKYTHGVDNTLENTDPKAARQNIRYMRMFGSAFMYAAGSHVGIGYGSCSGMIKGSPVKEGEKTNSLFGWGIGHEIGHNLDLLGKAEITNNIYALMIQTYDGKDNVLPSRLETSGKYNEIWNKVSVGAPGTANNLFVQLGMYWQLHLAYDDGKDSDPMGFYHAFSKEWQSDSYSGMDYNDKVAVVASKVANKDLTDFFTRWGMTLSESAKTKMAACGPTEDKMIWYLNDDARRYRINGKKGAASDSTVAVSDISVENNKTVNLSFNSTANDEDILGYEIERNKKVVGFTSEKKYTETIGTANHLSFSYRVRAVDKLGNASQWSDSKEIKISYTNTVNPDKYVMTRKGTSVTFNMNTVTPVTGIVVTPAPDSGSYKVVIKESEEQEFVTAKNGDFSQNMDGSNGNYIGYFTKPKADAKDTRMWTYDAEKIEITGIPENAQVQIISYPGDDIEWNDVAVGRLKNDYKYGDNAGDVIKAGTLIITGTYRGDPVYNTFQINGKFKSADNSVENASEKETIRAIAGYGLLFAELPEDKEVSDISNGIFIFVPNVQQEAELQEKDISHCNTDSILPDLIQAELFRTDNPHDSKNKRTVSNTLWMASPETSNLPLIEITSEGGAQ